MVENRRLGDIIGRRRTFLIGVAGFTIAGVVERSGARVCMSHGEFLAGYAVWNGLPGYNETDMVAQFRRNGLDAKLRPA